MLKNNNFENFCYVHSEGGGGGSENSGKICYLRQNTFADDPFSISLVVEVVPAILFTTMAKTSYNKKPRNLFIEWHFNLPLAPWHGGYFESLIHTVKLLPKKQSKTYV